MLLHHTELLMQSVSRSLAFQPGSEGTINSESKILVFFKFFSLDSSLKFSFRGIPALFSVDKLSFPGRCVPAFCCAGGFAWLEGASAAFYQRQSRTEPGPCVRAVLLNAAGEDDASFCSKAGRNSGGCHPKPFCEVLRGSELPQFTVISCLNKRNEVAGWCYKHSKNYQEAKPYQRV